MKDKDTFKGVFVVAATQRKGEEEIDDAPVSLPRLMKYSHGQKEKKEVQFLKVYIPEKAFKLHFLINGSPTKEFKLERGLRQGDPLSPFLFILAAKALNVAILEATNHNIFYGIKVGKDKLCISHLQYADDALISREWSLTNAKNLSRILTCFHLASGLKVNFNKSKLYGIGVSNLELNSIATLIG
ncbi:putative RNA-directed DNA polymerase, eukaryota, reverse transcriptase zinc-binding domain protein [Tanacetum coccineum]